MAAPEIAEIAERPPCLQGLQMRTPFVPLDLIGSQLQPALADVKLGGDSGYVLDPIGEPAEVMLRVRFPEPVRSRFREVPESLFTLLKRLSRRFALGDVVT